MKTKNSVTSFLYRTGFAICAAFLLAAGPASSSVNAASGASPLSGAEAGLGAAEKQFEQAEKQFENGVPAKEDKAAHNSAQKNGRMSWSEANNPQTATQQAQPQNQADPRSQALQGSPETGYSGTWRDPATGDIITSVIAPRPPQGQNYQNYPIVVEPNVGGDWGYSGGGYDTGWNGGYPQWPVGPENPGYGPFPGPVPPGPMPPPPPPMQMPNASNGFMPLPPPPDFNPGYRPLRPQPGGQPWQPGNPGVPKPPQWGQPGFNPGMPGQPGFNPGVPKPPQWGQPSNPGMPPQPGAPRPPQWGQPGFNPGMPGQPGFNPGGPRAPQNPSMWRPGQDNWHGGQWNRPPRSGNTGGFGSDHGRWH